MCAQQGGRQERPRQPVLSPGLSKGDGGTQTLYLTILALVSKPLAEMMKYFTATSWASSGSHEPCLPGQRGPALGNVLTTCSSLLSV